MPRTRPTPTMPAGPSVEIVEVDQQLASEWLNKYNTHNRNLRQRRVDAYARDMAAGRWQFNGDPIRFGLDDTLLDGQHRLWGVVESGVTVRFVVIRDLQPTTQSTMDIGAHRNVGDALTLRGEPNGALVAAIIRRVLMHDAGAHTQGGGVFVPTHAEISAYLESCPQIRRAVDVASRGRTAVPAAPSVIGAIYHLCARISLVDAERFFVDQLIDAIGLNHGDPARSLLRRLQEEASNRGRQMHPDDAFRYALLAWNHFRSGRTITKLQAPRGGWTSRNFPEPK